MICPDSAARVWEKLVARGDIAILQSHTKHTQQGAASEAPSETGNGGETQQASNLQQGCRVRGAQRAMHQEWRKTGDFPADPREYVEFSQLEKPEVVAGCDLQHKNAVGMTPFCTWQTARTLSISYFLGNSLLIKFCLKHWVPSAALTPKERRQRLKHSIIEAFLTSSRLTPAKHKSHSSLEKTFMIIDFLWFFFYWSSWLETCLDLCRLLLQAHNDSYQHEPMFTTYKYIYIICLYSYTKIMLCV